MIYRAILTVNGETGPRDVMLLEHHKNACSAWSYYIAGWQESYVTAHKSARRWKSLALFLLAVAALFCLAAFARAHERPVAGLRIEATR